MGYLAPMSCRPVLLPLCLAAALATPAFAQTEVTQSFGLSE